MKSFKDMLAETVDKPRSPDEQNFLDKHLVSKQDHPVAKDDQFNGAPIKKKSKRIADQEKDKEVYESSESEMTPEQEKKREEIIQSLKAKMGEFKSRYGDKAKDVMYATATKMAMKEEDVTEEVSEEITEGVLADLQDIVKTKSMKAVKFKDGKKQKVDLTTASMILSMHKQLNGANRKKVEGMLDDKNNFMKMIQFAMSAGK